ncbi:MAG: nickel-responsive transcriptional regulator NikR [Planctomycetota bacterium]|jgi:CopG family nickel-responsive transcriptional regulator
MTDLVRFGISIRRGLLDQFDAACEGKGYTNRSEAIRDLIRNSLVESEWEKGTRDTVGTVTLVYDHDVLDLPRKLTRIQHENEKRVVSTLHIHLDRHNCLEVLILRGPAREVKRLGENLTSVRGVKHGKFTMTTTGRSLQ